MILPNQGSSLFEDSFLNRTPRDNCFISGYEGPNESFQDFPNKAWNLISMVKLSDPDDETGTRGSSYKFAMLNSPEISHLWKNSHKSQLVKPILVKPVVLERGQTRLPQYKIPDTEEQ